jgi:hypothetical protein
VNSKQQECRNAGEDDERRLQGVHPENHAFGLFKSQDVKAWQRSIHRILRELVIGNGTWRK